jgi:predicted Rossmann-fold nucleotide-binding protein
MDECFETLTLIQTGRMGGCQSSVRKTFWEKAIDLDFLAEQGTISPGDQDISNMPKRPTRLGIISRFYGL